MERTRHGSKGGDAGRRLKSALREKGGKESAACYASQPGPAPLKRAGPADTSGAASLSPSKQEDDTLERGFRRSVSAKKGHNTITHH